MTGRMASSIPGPGGHLPFDVFMERSLYRPCGGYYHRTGRQGPAGDYLTSPTASGAFGRVLARALLRRWQGAGAPVIMEPGAGDGSLVASLAGEWERMEARGIEYHAVEISEEGREAIARLSGEIPPEIVTVHSQSPADLGSIPPFDQLLVVANEFVDALPFKRLLKTPAGLREMVVVQGPEGVREEPGELIRPPANREAARLLEAVAPGTVVEHCPREEEWAHLLARCAETCRVVVIDYCATHAHLTSGAYPEGSARGFAGHRLRGHLGARGDCDITRTVNLDLLVAGFGAAGFAVSQVKEQAQFLLAEGLAEVMETLTERERLAAKHLILPEGLGGYTVIEFVKGAA